MRQYSPEDIVLTWGPILFKGFGDGTMVTIEYDEDAVTKHVGAQGDVTVTMSANHGASIMVTLGQASPTNDLLSAHALAQRQPGNGLVAFPFLLKHINGSTLAETPECWIKKEPPIEFGGEHSNREWAFDSAIMIMQVGGSTR